MLTDWWLVPAGVVIAACATGVGIGGGILLTPLLILGFGLSPQQAVAGSLLIQIVGLGSGTTAHVRSGRVRPRIVITLFAAALPGIVLGSLLTANLPERPVKLALGCMALALALVFVSSREASSGPPPGASGGPSLRPLLPIPAFFGLLMGFLSTGVGEWLLPALRSRLRLDMKTAVATVTPLMFLLASVAGLCHVLLLRAAVPWRLVLLGALGTLVGGQLGPRIAGRLPDRGLKEAFVFGMTLVGIHLMYQAL